ncbi:MAG: S8 family peptidase [Deltaproteobacteria bacterium]|jgi:hypothetical protein|nr:S8 family peptidase [Deltaproteobacteria bacterium]
MSVKITKLEGVLLPDKVHVAKLSPDLHYAFAEAQGYIGDCFSDVEEWVRNLPPNACPGGYAVVECVLLPHLLSRAHFPSAFFDRFHLTVLGSHRLEARFRKVFVSPDGGAAPRGGAPLNGRSFKTGALFVAGRLEDLKAAAQTILDLPPDSPAAKHMAYLEAVLPLDANSRLKLSPNAQSDSFEVVLHRLAAGGKEFPLDDFLAYAKEAGFEASRELCVVGKDLIFVAARGPQDQLQRLAEFVFVREIKEMGTLRGLRPAEAEATSVSLEGSPPTPSALDENSPTVAIIDASLAEWLLNRLPIAGYHKCDPQSADAPCGAEHGLAVLSAAIWGPWPERGRPVALKARVSFYRALDADGVKDNHQKQYRVLKNIIKIIRESGCQFVNISLGPDTLVRDGVVHLWTATIDQLAYELNLFITVAAGNNGQNDRNAGDARIMVPADSVNAVTVGAADSPDANWRRAPYSAMGPGRDPSTLKPDFMVHGGSKTSPFRVLGPGPRRFTIANVSGTSFAAPYALRSAVELRNRLGPSFSPLSLKAYLIHHAQRESHDPLEVGWGMAPTHHSDEGPETSLFHFQGRLKPGNRYLAPLPAPEGGFGPTVTLKGTFCYRSPVTPHDPLSYALGALGVSFEPNMDAPPDANGRVPTLPFFDLGPQQRASDASDWRPERFANAKSTQKEYRGEFLVKPGFEIFFIERDPNTIEDFPVFFAFLLEIS